MSFTIVGLGEALFDLFPDGARLGGAPLNVAVHAHQLAQARGGNGVVVSRVGQDELGQRVFDELRQRGMTADYLQSDPDRPTGRVYVDVDFEGNATYDIAPNAAWDNLQFDPDLEDLAASCDAVCFGTLAQRDAQARNTIYRFLDAARSGGTGRAVRLLDVNLRASGGHDFYDGRLLRRSCEHASAVKLNRDELPIVLRAMGMPAPEDEDAAAVALAQEFDLEMVILTRGPAGTAIYSKSGNRYEGDPASYPPAEGASGGADSVGAGDACSAAILVGRVLRLPPQKIVTLANHAGAYVASQPGATPTLPDEILAMVK